MRGDPFTLEIIKSGLVVATEEMFSAFGRTAKSPVIYEVLDYAVGIADGRGELIAQAPGVPAFSGVLDYVAAETLEKWGGDLSPGDIVISNVPYESGTHLNDVALAMPLFYRDELIAIAINKGHWSEVGGMHFGSWTPDSTEIFQEGLQLPCVKIHKMGKPDRDVIDIILANSRLPDYTLGDMEAQIASMKVAGNRVDKLIEKYGIEDVSSAMNKLLDDGERYSYLKLKELPKGVFEAEDYIDSSIASSDSPIYVRVRVTITDDEFIADFTGSSEQVASSINSPFPATVSGVREAYMAMTDPHTHPNGGFFRPLRIIAPEGTIFHPVKPAPTSTDWEAISYATDLVCRALAIHVPDKLTAGHFLSILATILGGIDGKTGEPFAIVEPQPGGWGAGRDMDGTSGLVACGDGETYIASSEVYERNFPIMVDRYALNIEGGTGHGRYRGGFGVIRDYRVLSDEALFTVSVGRSEFPPWGVKNGLDSPPNRCVIRRGSEERTVRRAAAEKLLLGDVVSFRTAGGGGWGEPLKRDPGAVLEDCKNELIDLETAEEIYGVAIDQERGEIDWEATDKLRGPGKIVGARGRESPKSSEREGRGAI